MFRRLTILLILTLAVFGCSKKKSSDGDGGGGSGKAAAKDEPALPGDDSGEADDSSDATDEGTDTQVLPEEEAPAEPGDQEPEDAEEPKAAPRGGTDMPGDVRYFKGTAKQMAAMQVNAFNDRIVYLVNNYIKPQFDQFIPLPGVGEVLAGSISDQMYEIVPEQLAEEVFYLGDYAWDETAKKTVGGKYVGIANSAPDIMANIAGLNIDLDELAGALGCTAYIVHPSRSATGGIIVGRNLDWGSGEAQAIMLSDQWEPIIFHREEGDGFDYQKVLSIHIPGMVGVLSGINEKLVWAHIQVSEGYTSMSGMPAMLAFRYVLERAESAQHAVELFQDLHLAFGLNVVISDATSSYVLEIDSFESATRTFNDAGVLYATNHYVTPEMADNRPDYNVPDGRWEVVQKFDNNRSEAPQIGIDQVKDILAATAPKSTNVLGTIMDYETCELTFSSSLDLSTAAINGKRTKTINVCDEFASHN